MPFRIVGPRDESPLLVEVPHAGLAVPPEVMGTMLVPARAIVQDADLFVDELFQDAPSLGATLIAANYSRYVVDLNRGENDYDSDAVATKVRRPENMPRGLIWRLSTDGDRIAKDAISMSELERRLETIHRPYHRAVREILEAKKEKFGFAILLAGHSMPSVPRTGHPDLGRRADIVPGTNGRTTAALALIELVDAHAREASFSVEHDEPYKGGFSTRNYGKPAMRLHAIQIEMARRLYFDERTFVKNAGFTALRAWCGGLVERLAAVRAAMNP